MDNNTKQLFEQFDTIQTLLVQQALQSAYNLNVGALLKTKWKKTSNISGVFEPYVGSKYDNVLFVIMPSTTEENMVYINVYTNVDLKGSFVAPYPIEPNTIPSIADIVSEAEYPLNIIFKKNFTSKTINKWGFQVW